MINNTDDLSNFQDQEPVVLPYFYEYAIRQIRITKMICFKLDLLLLYFVWSLGRGAEKFVALSFRGAKLKKTKNGRFLVCQMFYAR